MRKNSEKFEITVIILENIGVLHIFLCDLRYKNKNEIPVIFQERIEL